MVAGGVILGSGEELVRGRGFAPTTLLLQRGLQLVVDCRDHDVPTSDGEPRRLRRFEEMFRLGRSKPSELVNLTCEARGKLLAELVDVTASFRPRRYHGRRLMDLCDKVGYGGRHHKRRVRCAD